jgi:cytochrome o ubiquinol oxidase subunit 2
MDVLHPEGPVGNREVSLIVISTLVMLIVVIPAIFLTFFFAWRYRSSNSRSTYDPSFSYSRTIDLTVWLVPFAIICFLIVLDWRSTAALNPYKSLPGSEPRLRVDVIALDWKWLFIYPDQHIASVNQLEIPVGTQVDFNITSDTVMNAFFIPQLGTQIYAMSGMVTQLHLIAKNAGTYRGLSANFSGAGFADMRFKTDAVSQTAFTAWINRAKGAAVSLNMNSFLTLAKPSTNNPVMYFKDATPGLFDTIVMAHSGPGPSSTRQETE